MKALRCLVLMTVVTGYAAMPTDHAMTCTPARWNVPRLTDCLWCDRGGLVPAYMCREPLDKANDAFKCWLLACHRWAERDSHENGAQPGRAGGIAGQSAAHQP
jgi:hypothetical protein